MVVGCEGRCCPPTESYFLEPPPPPPKSNLLATLFPRLAAEDESSPSFTAPGRLFKSAPIFSSALPPPLRGRSCLRVGRGATCHQGCSSISLAVMRFLGSSMRVLQSKSTPSSPTVPKVARKACRGCGGTTVSGRTYSGSLETPGQMSSVGVPMRSQMSLIWSSSVLPGRYGTRRIISAMTVPTDQMSTTPL